MYESVRSINATNNSDTNMKLSTTDLDMPMPMPSNTNGNHLQTNQYNNNINLINTKDDKFCSFDVHYKNVDQVSLGDVLHGWLEVNLSRPAVIVRMTVTFYGELEYEAGKQHKQSTRRFEKQTQELWREPTQHSMGAVLQPGVYVYEFFVGTRIDLPSAFIAKRGSVRSLMYYCEVCINEMLEDNRQVSHIKRRPVMLGTSVEAVPTLLHNAGEGNRAVVERSAKYVRNLMDMSGCMVCTVTLANQQCKPGDNLLYSVHLLNCFRRAKISVQLIQRAKVANRQSALFNTVTHTLYSIRLGSIRPDEPSKQWPARTVWVPDHTAAGSHVLNIYSGRVVFLGYELIVMVKPLIGKPLIVTLPLVVRNSLVITGHTFRNGTVQSGAATI